MKFVTPWVCLALLVAYSAGCNNNAPAPVSQANSGNSDPDASPQEASDDASDQPLQPEANELADAGDDAPGLSVGEQAPAFELTDHAGQTHSLASLLESGPVALVFYRSAVW